MGDMGRGVRKAYKNFLSVGVKQADIKLYPDLRHEILNEKSGTVVYHDVLAWIKGQKCFLER